MTFPADGNGVALVLRLLGFFPDFLHPCLFWDVILTLQIIMGVIWEFKAVVQVLQVDHSELQNTSLAFKTIYSCHFISNDVNV